MKVCRYEEAMDTVKGIYAKTDNAGEYFHLGVACVELGLYWDAIEAFRQAIHIQPDHAGAHFGLGIGFMSLNDIKATWNEYEILKNLDRTLAHQLLDLICLNKAREEILVVLKKVKDVLAESCSPPKT